jgi:hypothetical protein
MSHVEIVMSDGEIMKIPITPLRIYNNPEGGLLNQFKYIGIHDCPYCGVEQPRIYFTKENVPNNDTLIRLTCALVGSHTQEMAKYGYYAMIRKMND